MIEPVYAFIFDLDGTLVDSLRDISKAVNAALKQLGRRPAAIEQVRSWIGDGLPTLCRRAIPDADGALLAEALDLTRKHYQAHCADHARLYPKVLQMLDLLRGRHVPLAVLSNKPHSLTTQVVDALGLRPYFAQVRGCQRDEDKKPSPAAALEIAQSLGVRPEAVLNVGDSPVDVETARHARMIAVAVSWGYRDRGELLAARPDFLVNDPPELAQLPSRLHQRDKIRRARPCDQDP